MMYKLWWKWVYYIYTDDILYNDLDKLDDKVDDMSWYDEVVMVL